MAKKKFSNEDVILFNFSWVSCFKIDDKYGIKTIEIAPNAIKLKMISGNLKLTA